MCSCRLITTHQHLPRMCIMIETLATDDGPTRRSRTLRTAVGNLAQDFWLDPLAGLVVLDSTESHQRQVNAENLRIFLRLQNAPGCHSEIGISGTSLSELCYQTQQFWHVLACLVTKMRTMRTGPQACSSESATERDLFPLLGFGSKNVAAEVPQISVSSAPNPRLRLSAPAQGLSDVETELNSVLNLDFAPILAECPSVQSNHRDPLCTFVYLVITTVVPHCLQPFSLFDIAFFVQVPSIEHSGCCIAGEVFSSFPPSNVSSIFPCREGSGASTAASTSDAPKRTNTGHINCQTS